MPTSLRLPALVAACLAALCGACTSGPVTPAAVSREERIASWQKLCEGRGFVPGTSDFAVCVEGYDREALKPPPLPPSALQ